jgi:signal transduction histidine kinase
VPVSRPHLPHVFERFDRVEDARSASGSGLGLPIAKALIEAQGGTIALESRVGQGTRAIITLPSAE